MTLSFRTSRSGRSSPGGAGFYAVADAIDPCLTSEGDTARSRSGDLVRSRGAQAYSAQRMGQDQAALAGSRVLCGRLSPRGGNCRAHPKGYKGAEKNVLGSSTSPKRSSIRRAFRMCISAAATLSEIATGRSGCRSGTSVAPSAVASTRARDRKQPRGVDQGGSIPRSSTRTRSPARVHRRSDGSTLTGSSRARAPRARARGSSVTSPSAPSRGARMSASLRPDFQGSTTGALRSARAATCRCAPRRRRRSR